MFTIPVVILKSKSASLSQRALMNLLCHVLSNTLSDCRRNIDGVFMLDRSGSVRAKNHQIALEFIEAVAAFFTIGRNMSQFGVVAYSNSASIQFDLDDHNTFSRFQNAVSNVVFTGGATNTPDALNKARLLLNPANNRGARLSSVGIPKIAILITGNVVTKIVVMTYNDDLRS